MCCKYGWCTLQRSSNKFVFEVWRKQIKKQKPLHKMSLCLTTVTYNDRPTLKKVVSAVLEQTEFPPNTKWYFVMQHCTDEFAQEIVELCKGKVALVVIRFAENIGLSKAMRFIIEQTKYFEYVLNVEDDWIL